MLLHDLFETEEKPLAVIVKGNPKYLNDPAVKPMADKLYDEIKQLLQDRYTVKFDPGKAYTQPSDQAKLWIGHSRGIDRLQFAPKGVKTYALQTAGHKKDYQSHDESGHDPLHYELSDKDRKRLAEF